MKDFFSKLKSRKVYFTFGLIAIFALSGVYSLWFPTSSAQIAAVHTPFGVVPASCVYPVGSGVSSMVDVNGLTIVTYSNGATVSFPACSQKLNRAGHNIDTNGWVETGYTTLKTNSLTANWTVPTSPKSNDNQIIYMFPATQNCFTSCGDYVLIIQPVLQWGDNGAFGGAYWTYASWWVNSNGDYMYSKPIKVSVGDSLYGTLTASSCTKSDTCTWKIVGHDLTTSKSTTLTEKGIVKETTVFMTLEVYDVVSCKDYPAAGNTTFTGILVNGKTLSKSAWNTDIIQNDGCGENITINSGSSVTLFY